MKTGRKYFDVEGREDDANEEDRNGKEMNG